MLCRLMSIWMLMSCRRVEVIVHAPIFAVGAETKWSPSRNSGMGRASAGRVVAWPSPVDSMEQAGTEADCVPRASLSMRRSDSQRKAPVAVDEQRHRGWDE